MKINKTIAATITLLAGISTPVWAEHSIDPYGHVGNLAHKVHYAVHELCEEVAVHLYHDSSASHVRSDLRRMERYARDIERLAHHRADRRVLINSIHQLESMFRHVKYSLKHSDHDLFFHRTSQAYNGGHADHISEALHGLGEYIDHLDTATHKLPPARRIQRRWHGSHGHGVGHGSPGVVRRNPGMTVRLGNFAFRF